MILYYLAAIIGSFIVFKMYVAIKHPFWNRQPVFHIYNLKYWLYFRGIIFNTLPAIDTKYYDFNINFYSMKKLSNKSKSSITNFIKTNWYKNNIDWNPYIENLDRISILKKKDEIKGVICGEFLNYQENRILYVDYLCINKKYRGHQISPRLIYHIFINTFREDKTKIFLFKWENKNMNIVPLCVFNVFYFEDITFKTIENTLQLVEINKTSISKIDSLNIKKLFKTVIMCNIDVLLKKILDNTCVIYYIMNFGKLIGLYFFNKYTSDYYNLYASVNFGEKENFIYGFKKIINILKIKTITIDNISHNTIITKSILNEKNPVLIETHSYYFYNYIKIPENPEDVIVIN